MRNQWSQVSTHVIPHIQPNQVDQAEGGRLRASHQRTCDGIHLIHAVVVLEDEVHRERTRAEGDAVADEVGRVLAQHDALPHPRLAEVAHERGHFLRGIRRRDDLQQFQIARRVEEVCAEKVFLELLRAPFRNGLDGDARGVGADDGLRLADRVDARHQVLLDLEVFDDRLADPVRLGHGAEVIFQVAELDQRLQIRRHQIGGLGLDATVPAFNDNFVARCLVAFGRALRDNVQQRDGHTHVRQVRRDRRAHRPRTDHDCFVDLVGHDFL